MNVEDQLRSHFATYVESATGVAPPVAQLYHLAHAADRRRNRALAVVAVAVVALAAVGGLVVVGRHGQADTVGPAVPVLDPTSPFPGFTALASVHVPAGIRISVVSVGGGQVWVTGNDASVDPAGGSLIALHGPLGGTLTRVPGLNAQTVVVRGGDAFVTAYGSGNTGNHLLQVRDAVTGELRHTEDLTADTGLPAGSLVLAALAATDSDPADPLVVYMQQIPTTSPPPGADVPTRFRVATVAPDGTLAHLTPQFATRSDAVNARVWAAHVVVHTVDGAPRWLFTENGTRLDLTTGREDVITGVKAHDADLVGELGGRVFYQTGFPTGTPRLATVDPVTARVTALVPVPVQDISISGGHLFNGPPGGNPLPLAHGPSVSTAGARELDPVTSMPIGDHGAFTQLDVIGDGDTVATLAGLRTYGEDVAGDQGATLTPYAPVAGS